MAVDDNNVESTYEDVLLTASIGTQTSVQTDHGSLKSSIFIENNDGIRYKARVKFCLWLVKYVLSFTHSCEISILCCFI